MCENSLFQRGKKQETLFSDFFLLFFPTKRTKTAEWLAASSHLILSICGSVKSRPSWHDIDSVGFGFKTATAMTTKRLRFSSRRLLRSISFVEISKPLTKPLTAPHLPTFRFYNLSRAVKKFSFILRLLLSYSSSSSSYYLLYVMAANTFCNPRS